MFDAKRLNHEIIRLLKQHKITAAELARRTTVPPQNLNLILNNKKNLGERLFIKILRKGFDYDPVKIKKLFLNAVTQKYLYDIISIKTQVLKRQEYTRLGGSPKK